MAKTNKNGYEIPIDIETSNAEAGVSNFAKKAERDISGFSKAVSVASKSFSGIGKGASVKMPSVQSSPAQKGGGGGGVAGFSMDVFKIALGNMMAQAIKSLNPVSAIINYIKSNLSGTQIFGKFQAGFDQLLAAFGRIKDVAGNVFVKLLEISGIDFGKMAENIEIFAENAGIYFLAFVKTAQDIFTEFSPKVIPIISNFVMTAYNAVTGFFTSAYKLVMDYAKPIWESIKWASNLVITIFQAFQKAYLRIMAFIADAASKVIGWFGGKDTAEFMKTFGQELRHQADNIGQEKSPISNPEEPKTSIADIFGQLKEVGSNIKSNFDMNLAGLRKVAEQQKKQGEEPLPLISRSKIGSASVGFSGANARGSVQTWEQKQVDLLTAINRSMNAMVAKQDVQIKTLNNGIKADVKA